MSGELEDLPAENSLWKPVAVLGIPREVERAAVGKADAGVIWASDVDCFEGLEPVWPKDGTPCPYFSARLAEVGNRGVRGPDGLRDLLSIY